MPCVVRCWPRAAWLRSRPDRTGSLPPTYDRHLYKERNLSERMFNRLKTFHRLSTRYDKTDLSFLSFLHLVGAFLWLQ
jgi:transposase